MPNMPFVGPSVVVEQFRKTWQQHIDYRQQIPMVHGQQFVELNYQQRSSYTIGRLLMQWTQRMRRKRVEERSMPSDPRHREPKVRG